MLPFACGMPWRHEGGSDPLKLKMHQTLFRQTYKLSGLRPSFLLFTDTVNKNPCYSNMIHKRKLCPKVQTLTEMVYLLYTFYWQKVPPSYASSRTAYPSEISGNLKSFFLCCFVFSTGRWPLTPNFCPWATRKSQIFHTNHMLGTLDFTVSEHWAPFNFP